MEQKSLDGDPRIVDLLGARSSHLITDFAAVAVDAVSDAVEKAALHAVDFNERKILYVAVDLDGSVTGLFAQVVPEVIAASCREIIQRLRDLHAVSVINEAVERAVTSAEVYFIGLSEPRDEAPDIAYGSNIHKYRAFAAEKAMDILGFFLAGAVA